MSKLSIRRAFELVPLCLLAMSPLVGQCSVADAADVTSGPTHRVQIDGITFTLPTGLVVQRIADPALVHWPMLADWDSTGRLVVVESGGVSRPIEQDNQRLAHRVVRLSDSDGDGVFDTKIIAADQLPFTEGVLCLEDRLLVTAPPNILELVDHDGDGYCEDHRIWFEGQTITGCANDLHGPYEGPDGWIYWCKGAFAEQTHTLIGGKQIKTTAAHLFRRHRNGGAIESVACGGMDNPVEIAFLPSGERFFTSTFLQHPVDGKRDGIAHAVYGGVHGKDHSVIGGHMRTGPLLPITIHLGAAAPSGLTHLRGTAISQQLTAAHGDFIAAALFNHHKVTAHQMIPIGASYQSVDFDLLIGDRVDFHPTDVIEAADGSLIVIDTGGWYDLCCPSSRLDQKAAPGGIYRIYPAVGTSRSDSTNPTDTKDPIPLLWTTDHVARKNAQIAILEQGNQALDALVKTIQTPELSTNQRCSAAWMLCRLASPEAIRALIGFIDDRGLPDAVRCAAGHAISLHLPREASAILEAILIAEDTPPHLRRIAAEATGRLASPSATTALMKALTFAQHDPILEHSILFALIETSDLKVLESHLDTQSPEILRGLLVVLHQLKKQAVPLEVVLAAARHQDSRLRETALQVIREQGLNLEANELVRLLRNLRAQGASDTVSQETLVAFCQAYAQSNATIEFIAEWISLTSSSHQKDSESLIALLRSIPLTKLPEPWHAPLAELLINADVETIDTFVPWLRSFTTNLAPSHPMIEALGSRIHDSQLSTPTRLVLCSCLPTAAISTPTDFNSMVIDIIANSDDRRIEVLAITAVSQLRLAENDIDRLTELLDIVPPLNLNRTLLAISRHANDTQLAKLLEVLSNVPSAKTLTADELQKLTEGRGLVFQEQAKSLATKLQSSSEDVRKRVNEVLGNLNEGDALRGYQVFLSDKAACITCHKMAYQGRSIGPDLTQIGRSRTTYDLLEAILFPNARLEQSFQSTKFLTTDGRVLNGIVRSEFPESIELILSTGETLNLDRKLIEKSFPSDQSIMPTGLAEQLSLQELADLVAFLKSNQ